MARDATDRLGPYVILGKLGAGSGELRALRRSRRSRRFWPVPRAAGARLQHRVQRAGPGQIHEVVLVGQVCEPIADADVRQFRGLWVRVRDGSQLRVAPTPVQNPAPRRSLPERAGMGQPERRGTPVTTPIAVRIIPTDLLLVNDFR